VTRTRTLAFWLTWLIWFGGAAPAAAADLIDSINALRTRGCATEAGTKIRLTRTLALDAVAKEWAKGGRLKAALERADYRAINSSSMRLSGAADDRAIINVLASNYCGIVTNSIFTDIGIERRGRELWLVVAAPLKLPSIDDAKRVAGDVLERVNAARSQPRKCGSKAYPAAAPVALSAQLNRAALLHAQDMARNDHFEHTGTDGSTPAQRVTRVGYRFRAVAENIAAGANSAAAVVDGWLASPGHCVNIMTPHYQEMGIAYALETQSDAGIYWSQVFATGR